MEHKIGIELFRDENGKAWYRARCSCGTYESKLCGVVGASIAGADHVAAKKSPGRTDG